MKSESRNLSYVKMKVSKTSLVLLWAIMLMKISFAQIIVDHPVPTGATFEYTATVTIPDGITSINISAWGGGAGGNGNQTLPPQMIVGGGGGTFSRVENIPVTPGEVLNVQIGRGGSVLSSGGFSNTGLSGGNTIVSRGTTNLVLACGGPRYYVIAGNYEFQSCVPLGTSEEGVKTYTAFGGNAGGISSGGGLGGVPGYPGNVPGGGGGAGVGGQLAGAGASGRVIITEGTGGPDCSVAISPANPSVCAGNSVNITATGSSTYTWSSGAGLSDTTGSSVIANPSGTTTYTVTGVSGNCSATASVTVTVLPKPTATITPASATICAGDSITLRAGTGQTYSWNRGSTADSIRINPTTTTSYTVTVTGNNNCTASASATVNVNAAPPASIINNTGTATLSCSIASISVTATGGTSYAWSGGINSTGANNVLISAGTYTVTVRDANNCTAKSAITINSDLTPPPAVINPAGPLLICGNGGATLTASLGNTYLWSNSATSQSIQVTQSGTYTVTVTYGNNCSAASSPVLVTVNPIPATPNAASNSPVKLGDTIKLSTGSVANATYRWTGPGGFSSSQQNPVRTGASIPMAGTYTITDTVNGCGSAPASVTVELFGQVTGKIKTETNIGVKKTTLLAAGTPNLSYLTDMTGNYTFNLKAGNSYTITPFKNNDSILNNGVTIADYMAVRSHIRGNKLLRTPYKIIAADVNSDGVVNNSDLDIINKMINNQFGLLVMGKLWSFVPHDHVFSNPQNPFPFPSSRTHSITNSFTNQDFIGMKLGDVNNSWNPNRSSTDTLELSVPDLTVNKDSDILVPIIANNFNVISGFQFTLQWDPAVLTYKNVDTTLGALKVEYGEDSVAVGKLVVSWIDPDSSTTLPDDTELFYVRFNASGNYDASSAVSINSEISVVEAIDSAFENVEVKTEDGEVSINDDTPVSIQTTAFNGHIQGTVFPNPFDQSATLRIEASEDKKVQMDLYDPIGRLVRQETIRCTAGDNLFTLDHFGSAGVYILRLSTENYSQHIRIILK